jgi:hypothetical protein
MGILFWRGRVSKAAFRSEFIAAVRGRLPHLECREADARGEGGDYSVRRLKRGLTPTGLAKLHRAAGKYAGRPYDLYFEWSDERIYCSELAWKLYRDALGIEIGARQQLRDFDLTDAVVRRKMRERYGDRVPLKEPVISPAAMYDSPLLETVTTR